MEEEHYDNSMADSSHKFGAKYFYSFVVTLLSVTKIENCTDDLVLDIENVKVVVGNFSSCYRQKLLDFC